MFLIFDTETTGLPKNWNAPITDSDNWPRMVQLAWQIHDEKGVFVENKNYVVIPEGYEIPFDTVQIHGITTEKAYEIGIPLTEVLEEFNKDLEKCTHIIGHNVGFDINIVGAEYYRKGINNPLLTKISIDTKDDATDYCKIPGKGNRFKWPRLEELHEFLFNEKFNEAHNASADVNATARCFLELVRLGVISDVALKQTPDFVTAFKQANPNRFKPAKINLISNFENKKDKAKTENEDFEEYTGEKKFVHLHVHTQYSILDGAASIPALIKKAKEQEMPAIAITDHGNMFGVKEFHAACCKNEIKPILGCDAYIVDDIQEKDKSNYHIVLLAKNYIGYKNLLKLVSFAHLEGMYYKPRIDKGFLEKHSEGLIMLSGGLRGEIASAITSEGLEAAEKKILWYKNLFKDDLYFEVQRHPSNNEELKQKVTETQKYVEAELEKFAAKHNIKIVATNDVHFINEEDADAHDLLICMSSNSDLDDPRRKRYTQQEWFKTTDEMFSLWGKKYQYLLNTLEVVDKIEEYKLDHSPIMPEFDVPESFGTVDEYRKKYTEETLKAEFENYDRLGDYESVLRIKFESDYLAHLTWKGAVKRYGEDMPESHRERLGFELNTIKQMGFPGYFLIVQDFIAEGRKMGVFVGPGRGSAAGAVVSYCLWITNIDPIKFDLLFERFLNPDRISMPDIDIDFDDEGRQKVLDWVTKKYGADKVAHICTFGTMAAKSALKDVARVLKMPLPEVTRITKDFPENGKLGNAFNIIQELEKKHGGLDNARKQIEENKKKAKKEEKGKVVTACDVQLYFANEIEKAREDDNQTEIDTIKNACVLEGSVRQTGVHACGILIGKNPLNEHIPLMPTKGEEMLSTQYDGHYVEDIGLLKMDFLGLRTLSIIKETLLNIKLSTGDDVDVETLDSEDEKTFELFGNGDTTAIFQFESPGMKKHLRNLKPSRFEDLVAMNALYRPGPMEYIPDFIARKHGQQEVVYDHPLMEKYLNGSYGITVFQEQVMLLSRELGGFTRGDSDSLRKAMGKKIIAMMDKLKVKFIDGCLANPEFMEKLPEGKKAEDLIEKIWKDWEAFASYAFNKSHSVCYAYIAYQTAWLKAHYPAQFMAAALSCNLSKADEIAKLMEECSRMQLPVKVPDVNESQINFAVNKKGEVRFGLGAIKGVGEAASQAIIDERKNNGPFKDIFDFVSRVNLRTVNKKNLESLALSGGFDSFGIERHRFFAEEESGTSFIEILLKFGNSVNAEPAKTGMNSLFGEEEIQIETPQIPNPPKWANLYTLKKEKECIGIYLSAHPLDEFKMVINHFCKVKLSDLKDVNEYKDRDLTVAGLITRVDHKMSAKSGNAFGILVVEDFNDTHEFALFGKDYEDLKTKLITGEIVSISGRVEKNKWQENSDYKFKIKNIEPLSVLRDKIKNLTINININDLDDEMIQGIKDITEQGTKAGLPVRFIVYDRQKEVLVKMSSDNLRTNLSLEFFEYLESIPKIKYDFNTN